MKKAILLVFFMLVVLPLAFSASQYGKYDDFEGNGTRNTTKWTFSGDESLTNSLIKEGSYALQESTSCSVQGCNVYMNNYTIPPGGDTLIQLWHYYNGTGVPNKNYFRLDDGATSSLTI